MRRRVLLMLAFAAAATPIAGGLAVAPASAGCVDDNTCDPPPHPLDNDPVRVDWGCGTTTIYVLDRPAKTIHTRFCPGP